VGLLGISAPELALNLPGFDYDGPDRDGFSHYTGLAVR